MKNERYVPLEKQSKRRQRAHHSALRSGWEGVMPVTRVVPDKRRQGRQQQKSSLRRELQG